jgi:hypothetical protein
LKISAAVLKICNLQSEIFNLKSSVLAKKAGPRSGPLPFDQYTPSRPIGYLGDALELGAIPAGQGF